jgi:hypothetical protein
VEREFEAAIRERSIKGVIARDQGEDDGDSVAPRLLQELTLHHCRLQAGRGVLKGKRHENFLKI